jgi:hypothetical protein
MSVSSPSSCTTGAASVVCFFEGSQVSKRSSSTDTIGSSFSSWTEGVVVLAADWIRIGDRMRCAGLVMLPKGVRRVAGGARRRLAGVRRRFCIWWWVWFGGGMSAVVSRVDARRIRIVYIYFTYMGI